MAKAKLKEPNLSPDALTRRSKQLAVEFGKIIGLSTGELAFAMGFTSTDARMDLVGRASEAVNRNRGGQHRVVPIVDLGRDFWMWVGYRESWSKEGTEKNLRFVDAGLTIHLGRQGELSKPQLFRSEWVSRRSRAFVDRAGHPHWQFDALESARVSKGETRQAKFAPNKVRPDPAKFGQQSEPEEAPILAGLTLERMHFASAAQWWQTTDSNIVHAPESVSQLDRWTLRCVAYLREEVGHCTIGAATA